VKRPRFSRRTAWDLRPNAHATGAAEARAHADGLVDLTESNPTRVGLGVGAELVALLGDARGTAYDPSPFGGADARAEVARYYAAKGVTAPVERIALSASTSESYAWLFKLLCDPGDRVLVPRPSYPLLALLADLEVVDLAHYDLVESRGFAIDLDGIADAIDARTRAVVLVSPNNPTGTFVKRAEADALAALCADRGVALVVDEVFGDYAHAPLDAASRATFAGEARALTFTLSGLSKVVAMPQGKLGWIVASGPDGLVDEAVARLEVIADTYLSVATGVQLALPGLLAARAEVQAKILTRVRENLAALDAALVGSGGARHPIEAGWYAVLVPPDGGRDDDAWSAKLMREARALVQPGYFFDFVEGTRLVVSLLPPEDAFAPAARAIAAAFRAVSGG
jgi:hypothetical protein